LRQLRKSILILHSPQDDVVGVENAKEIYEAAFHPKSFVSLDGADHLLSEKKDSVYVGEVIAAWAGRYLELADAEEPLRTDKQVAVRTGDEGFTTEIRAGNHGLIADEPVKLGGNDFGPTPYDLLVAGLGACTSITLRMYADRKKWDLEEVVVHLQHAKIHAEDCATCGPGNKLDTIYRGIELKGNLTEEQRQRLLEIAEKCPVHRTLTSDIKIETELEEV
jgi:putative redox protein